MGKLLELNTVTRKKRLVGLVLFAVILALFFSLNRFPKLDIVGGDLEAISGPEVQCFQGFCIERGSGSSFLSQWWVFTVTYLRLVTVGMTFAFLVAGLTEAFLFSSGSGRWYASGGVFKRTIKGMATGPVMNLCSACIVPVSTAFQRRGAGIAGAIAMVQASATMNIPALAMVFFVFTPVLGFSRLVLALVGALLIGPIVVMSVRMRRGELSVEPEELPSDEDSADSPWGPVLADGFRAWAKLSIGYLVRMGPIMVAAGFISGAAIQWVSPETVSTHLGNDVSGVAIAATFGVLINVPLLFEIPLVALMMMLGMGVAPAATLLFTAAAGGPITFWGLAAIMPKRGVATFATATWAVGVLGGLAVLGVSALDGVSDSGPGVRARASAGSSGDRSPSFIDVTSDAGIDFLHHGVESEMLRIAAGVVVFDFNDDGFQDIYVVDSVGANALYRNNGDESFTDIAVSAGLDDPLARGNGACSADYDGDGDQDLFVTNYGFSKLFRNNGDGTFVDVSEEAGVGDSNSSLRSTGCAWGDYDQDGFLDFIVVRHMHESDPRLLETKDFSGAVRPLALYHNAGEGTFTEVTHLLGDTSAPAAEGQAAALGNVWGAGFQPGWIDFDNDGDLDIYVVNDFGAWVQPNVFWRNDGPSTEGDWIFVDASEGSEANVRMWGMGLAVGDYDLDGDFDFFMTNIGNSVLLRNNGDGKTFTDVTYEANVGKGLIDGTVRFTWGTVFFDYDNDGDEDLYVVSGYLEGGLRLADLEEDLQTSPEEQPNLLLQNKGDGSFVDVSSGSGADDSGIGRGGSYLDFNNDGCVDLFVSNYGQRAKLFKNLCEPGNNWLVVHTNGASANRDGVGARITVVAGEKTQIRQVTSGSSQMGQNMLAAHFGLGTASVADSVTVRWPSGRVQTLTDVAANQRLTVTEPQ